MWHMYTIILSNSIDYVPDVCPVHVVQFPVSVRSLYARSWISSLYRERTKPNRYIRMVRLYP